MASFDVVLPPKKTTVEYDKTIFVTNNHGDNLVNVDNGLAAKALVQQVLTDQISRIDTNACEPGEEDAFYVADLGEVYRQHVRWKMNLPRVKPFYAVKCNPDKEVLRLLANLGTGFDCASKAEIDLVLSLGVDPSRIIYAQPCKTKSYLRHAERMGVKQMTFDNADELFKIKNCFPGAEIVLRILTDDSSSLCRLSTKFGADLDTAIELLSLAKELGLNLVGVSFHVGSGASDPDTFARAVRDAKHVFDEATNLGFDLKLLDVGGGFVDETFEVFAESVNNAVEEYFPPHIRVIAEPGRYYTANAFTLATNVIARREVISSTTKTEDNRDKSYMLYLNDGVYGNFSNIIFDHQHPVPRVLHAAAATGAASSSSSTPLSASPSSSTESLPPIKAHKDVQEHDRELVEYSIWGPTCDGIDVITEHCLLPGTLNIGDWLFFENMGAYTRCSATRFNGFRDDHEVIYISSEPGASALLGY